MPPLAVPMFLSSCVVGPASRGDRRNVGKDGAATEEMATISSDFIGLFKKGRSPEALSLKNVRFDRFLKPNPISNPTSKTLYTLDAMPCYEAETLNPEPKRCLNREPGRLSTTCNATPMQTPEPPDQIYQSPQVSKGRSREKQTGAPHAGLRESLSGAIVRKILLVGILWGTEVFQMDLNS